MIDADALVELQEASLARAEGGLRDSWPRASAMDAEELRSFLDARRYCVVATATSRGRPVARPVAFTVVGGSFWFATVAGSRLRNITRTPWISIVASAGDAGDHQAVAADGPTTIVQQPPEDVLVAWETKHGGRPDWASAWFAAEPTRLVSYSATRARPAEP